MSMHDLVKDGEIVRSYDFDLPPTLAPNKGAWLPRVVEGEDLQADADHLLELAVTIEADRVVYVRSLVQRPLDDLKAEFRAAVTARSQAAFAEGYRHPTGALAGKVLACLTDEDRTNWLTRARAWKAAQDGGNGAVVAAKFRTRENETVVTSIDYGVAVLDGIDQWGSSIYDRRWALKDAADGADTYEAFVAVRDGLDGGWPE